MVQKVTKALREQPVGQADLATILLALDREILPVLRELRQRFNELFDPEGFIVGPDGAVNNNLMAFDGITGLLAKDSGYSVADILLFRAAVTVITIPDATLTLGLIHRGALLVYTNAAGCAVTIPAVFAATDVIYHIQGAAGQVSFTGSGVTVNKQGTLLALTAELNAPAATIFTSSTVCYLSGALEAA